MSALDATSYDSIVHIIQLSLSPIFLLSAVATLLNVFTTRLGRIKDQVDALAKTKETDEAKRHFASLQLAYLRHRSYALDAAVALAALSGALTCTATLTLFFGILRDKATAWLLFVQFGAAIGCTIFALGAFLTEVLMASRGLRAAVDEGRDRLE